MKCIQKVALVYKFIWYINILSQKTVLMIYAMAASESNKGGCKDLGNKKNSALLLIYLFFFFLNKICVFA